MPLQGFGFEGEKMGKVRKTWKVMDSEIGG